MSVMTIKFMTRELQCVHTILAQWRTNQKPFKPNFSSEDMNIIAALKWGQWIAGAWLASSVAISIFPMFWWTRLVFIVCFGAYALSLLIALYWWWKDWQGTPKKATLEYLAKLENNASDMVGLVAQLRTVDREQLRFALAHAQAHRDAEKNRLDLTSLPTQLGIIPAAIAGVFSLLELISKFNPTLTPSPSSANAAPNSIADIAINVALGLAAGAVIGTYLSAYRQRLALNEIQHEIFALEEAYREPSKIGG